MLVHSAAGASELDRCVLVGPPRARPPAFLVVEAGTAAEHAAFRALRRDVFVDEQGLFDGHDGDDVDDDPRTVVLLARGADGTVLGGVRLAPVPGTADIGWWSGSRLAVAAPARARGGIGPALVRAACARAEQAGVVRFDAHVQQQNERLFTRLGWTRLPAGAGPRPDSVPAARPHVAMTWPIARFARLAQATKQPLGELLKAVVHSGAGFTGDDAAPVPGSDLVAACDAILPAMVERDPEWAGWCGVLVNVNDVLAMGAQPVGLLDAVAGRDAAAVARVLDGVRRAAQAFDLPVLGGHTQLGVPAALSVTALGRAAQPVRAGGASAGHCLRVTADLGGGWRPGYAGAQWDSSSHRNAEELRALAGVVPALRPAAAKDVSMAGLAGTAGMLAEASGVKAVLDVVALPRPAGTTAGDWLACFPGFAMVTAEVGAAPWRPSGLPDFVDTAVCGWFEEGAGVQLQWPDGVRTSAIDAGVTGMGAA